MTNEVTKWFTGKLWEEIHAIFFRQKVVFLSNVERDG
jgi:hypothetical protein